MCGIAGIVSVGNCSNVEYQWLRVMNEALFHRGPDAPPLLCFDTEGKLLFSLKGAACFPKLTIT